MRGAMRVQLQWQPLIALAPSKPEVFDKSLFISSYSLSTAASYKCCCLKNGNTRDTSEGFCVLKSDFSCDSGDVWSTMALYVFSLHIPLSFGGLSVAAQILRQPVLDPDVEALSILAIQTLELIGALMLLRFSGKQQYKNLGNFQANDLLKGRNWMLASALGFGLIVLLILVVSFLADRLYGPKDVNNPIVKEILMSGSSSKIACFLVYCVVTPLLEETIYRGFLLTSLASMMKWQQAVVVSSAVFSAAHLSGENFLPLFIIGCVLGCSYCWSGNLGSSVVIHSLYNALILFLTLNS